MSAGREVLVRVKDLKVHFPVRRGVLRRQVGAIQAVDGLNFDIREGETLGLVGESGSGKSTTGRALLRLLEPTAGAIEFAGDDLAGLDAADLRARRREMQMIFQDPYASLNPRMTIGPIVGEPLGIHDGIPTSSRVVSGSASASPEPSPPGPGSSSPMRRSRPWMCPSRPKS